MLLQSQEPTLVACFHEFVDQRRGGDEGHRERPLTGGKSQPQCGVRLARTAWSQADASRVRLIVEGARDFEAGAGTLLAHEETGYEEWGAAGAVRIGPGASGRGLSLTLDDFTD